MVSLVEAAKYEECVARLTRLLDPSGARPLRQPDIVEKARLYEATCLIGLGKDEQADEPLRAAIRNNPQMRAPDSLVFPSRVVDRFIRVRDQMSAEIREQEQKAIEKAQLEAAAKVKRDNEQWAQMLKLERLARQEVVVERHSRGIALVPFGAGQFQNGNRTLGWTFLISEAVLGAGALTSLAVHANISNQVDRLYANSQTPAPDVKDRQRTWYFAMGACTYGFLGMALVGIVEGQLSFVSEVKHVRDRPLPRELQSKWPSLRPEVAIGAGGVSLGVRGRF